ncbi:hypothetical protein HSB1_30210 [Halogranum salarium B-1]|uniref:Uncharacterized protein n=1 Tax=Halogranum salarium B-1 TaxID=1210908 RepID=J2ZZR8_9EURY|nr:hypothetical protein HSB1_30210 [Halogranum salarium B-1]
MVGDERVTPETTFANASISVSFGGTSRLRRENESKRDRVESVFPL